MGRSVRRRPTVVTATAGADRHVCISPLPAHPVSDRPETGVDRQWRGVLAAYVAYMEGSTWGADLRDVDWSQHRPRLLQLHPEAGSWIDAIRFGRTPPAHRASRESDEASDELELVPYSEIAPRPVRWLWRDRIALGALTLLVGVPGLGKTLLACWLAARVSRGDLDGDLDGPGGVLYATAEDSPEYTLLPRMIAAGADRARIHDVRLHRDGLETGLTLPDDVLELGTALQDVRARLLVVDPVMAHLGDGLDSHRDHSIRRALAPLYRVAHALDIAGVPIGHLNKAPSGDVFARVGGSIGLSAAARSILLLTPDPRAEDDDRARVLTHAKTNLGQLAPAMRMRVEGRELEGGIRTAAIVPGEEAPDLRVADVLAPARSEEERTERDEAIEWLRGELADGPIASNKILRSARHTGIAEKTLRRAMKAAGVRAVRQGFGPGGEWVWTIDGHIDTIDAHSQSEDIYGGTWPSMDKPGPPPDPPVEPPEPEPEPPEPDHKCACRSCVQYRPPGCTRSVGRAGIECGRCSVGMH